MCGISYILNCSLWELVIALSNCNFNMKTTVGSNYQMKVKLQCYRCLSVCCLPLDHSRVQHLGLDLKF